MDPLVASGLGLATGVVVLGIAHAAGGIEQEHRIEKGKIYSRTWTLTDAPLEEAVRLLQTDWSWWKKARAGEIREIGGRKQFAFHPICFFNVIQVPPAFFVRFERTEDLAGGGKRIHATLAGDFCGPAEYTARPGVGGTVVELAWCGAEVRSVLRFMPTALVAAIHCWRERLGVEGLRDRLGSNSAN
jgi:hypothetical protein